MTQPQLIKKLDAIFSIYIRRRYAINDIAECFTCGKKMHWKDAQCGHHCKRQYMSTRFR